MLQSELFGAEFMFSLYAKELIVGDVFIRIYNEQPTFVLTVRSIVDVSRHQILGV